MGDDSLSSKLAIYISCSAPNDKPTFPFLYNIYAGAALNNNTIDSDTLKDNIGDNISEKNPYYCELTVHYYAWKNTNADYLGFFHSRRYISFNRQSLVDKGYSKRKLPKPYIVKDFPTKELLEKNGYDKENIISLLKIYPIIGVIPEKMPETTYEHLIRTQKNGKTEFKLIEEKLKLNYPEFLPAFNEYMSSRYLYFCNMYVMHRDIFDKYCSWLFDILEYVDTNMPQRIERDDGMMAERLFGVFMIYIKKEGSINWAELPRIHFAKVGGATKNFSCNKLGNLIFPPGSFRRNILRKIVKG